MTSLRSWVLIGLCIVQFAASTLAVFGQGVPLNTRIPKSDPKKYQGILDAKDWKNPQLIVRPTGVEIIGITPAGSAIPVDSVFNVLGNLHSSIFKRGEAKAQTCAIALVTTPLLPSLTTKLGCRTIAA